MIPQVQIPDFAGTIGRGIQQRSMLADLASQNAVNAALADGGGQALFGQDAAARESVLARLAGHGRHGLATAMPFWQQEQQRMRTMSPEEAQALGLRPGTVAQTNRMGNVNTLQQPDTVSGEAEAQRIRIANASRAPSQPPSPIILSPGQTAYHRDGRVLATGAPREQSPFESSEGGDAQILHTLGPVVAGGAATPDQQRMYAIAATRWQSSGQQVAEIPDPNNPGTTLRVAIPRPLPPGFPAPPALGGAPPAQPAQPAPAPPAAPGQQGAVPIPGTGVAAAPPPGPAPVDPNAPRVLGSRPNDGPSATDRTRLRTIEVEADGIRSALDSFREVRRNASLAERAQSAAGMPTALTTAWSNTALLAKGEALYNLGVLNGPDLTIIQRTLSDPATVRGFLTGQDTAEAQIRAIETLLEQRLRTARVQYGGQAPASAPAAPGATSRPAPPQPGTVMDGYRFRGGNPAERGSWERVP